jgi:hypothetical protein
MEKSLIKILFILSVFALMLSPRITFAQDDFSYGSPYTIFGIGNNTFYNNDRISSMGVYGVALNGGSVNTLNPAANSSLANTIFSIGLKYNYLKSSDGINTMKTKTGNATGFNLGVPIDRDLGWSLALGFNPLYQVDYKVMQDISVGGIPATATYAGNGGITKINGGMSFAGIKPLSIGVEYNFAFGNLKKLSQLDFKDENVINSYRRTEDDLKGSFLKAGMVLDLKKMFTKLPDGISQSRIRVSVKTETVFFD